MTHEEGEWKILWFCEHGTANIRIPCWSFFRCLISSAPHFLMPGGCWVTHVPERSASPPAFLLEPLCTRGELCCCAVGHSQPHLSKRQGMDSSLPPATAQWMDVSVGPQSFCPDLVILYGRWLEFLWRSSRNEHLNDSGAGVAPGTSLKLYFNVGSVMLKPSGTGMVSSLLIMRSIQQVA